MSWRSTQLDQELCDQDRIILNLFADKDVNYIGRDVEFRKLLNHNSFATNLILIVDDNVWCSDIIKMLNQHLKYSVETFYIGLNRYCVKGNDTEEKFLDTGNHGNDLISMIDNIVSKLNYSVIKSGCYDNDFGRYFNFVQPLTWAYGSKTNTGN
jgi:hypothetical protein